MQAHLTIFHLRPDAPLRLHYAKKSGLAESLKRSERFTERLIGVEMENGFPTTFAAFGNPLFDGEKSVRHGRVLLWSISGLKARSRITSVCFRHGRIAD